MSFFTDNIQFKITKRPILHFLHRTHVSPMKQFPYLDYVPLNKFLKQTPKSFLFKSSTVIVWYMYIETRNKDFDDYIFMGFLCLEYWCVRILWLIKYFFILFVTLSVKVYVKSWYYIYIYAECCLCTGYFVRIIIQFIATTYIGVFYLRYFVLCKVVDISTCSAE